MLRFKIWLEDQADAELYFSIGHGDYDDEYGSEPDYIVWAYINGNVEATPIAKIDSDTGIERGSSYTHSHWGHHTTDQTYKGRFEPETGRISIVKPSKWTHRDVPESLMNRLHQKFKNIKQVFVF